MEVRCFNKTFYELLLLVLFSPCIFLITPFDIHDSYLVLGSTFVLAQRFQIVHTPKSSSSSLYMGSSAKFGIFSPAVYAAKVVLGQDKLNKIRGKAISLHSEAIGDFCLWAGAYHLRTKLIKKAKTNGDTLGFLV